MTRRAFRVLLFLGLLGAAGLAGYQGWKLERARVQQLASAGSFDTITLRLAQAVIDLRASERGYVSSGQGYGYWQPRVEALLQQIRQDLTALKSSAAPDAAPAVDAALDALKETTRLERRIAEAAQAGRIQFAADLVYADGLQASLALERTTNAAIAAARGDLDAYQRDARIQELLLAGESACIGLFLALMWFPSQRKPASASVPAGSAAARGNPVSSSGPTSLGIGLRAESSPRTDKVSDIAAARGGLGLDLPLRPPPPDAAPARATAARAIQDKAERDRDRANGKPGELRDATAGAPAAAAALGAAATGAAASAGAPNSARTTGGASANATASAAAGSAHLSGLSASPAAASRDAIVAAADLCTSLARVTDAQELKGLLAQMSRQLDAAGVIVWLATPDGLSLRPALSHGYPAEAIARLDRLDLASDNATARAFRLARPQTVPARDSIAGAIVVPITSGSGCVGAVAAELRHGREQDATTLALARIFAAQLATLTGPAAGSDPT